MLFNKQIISILVLIIIAFPASAEEIPQRDAYFGETHIHSDWSEDAYVYGTRLTPEDEVKYARGEAVTHPGGFKVQLSQPLDFTVVMDHSEYTGALAFADDPDSPSGKMNQSLPRR